MKKIFRTGYQFYNGKNLQSVIANIINGPPTRLGNIISNYEKIDLVTPNQLHLVRNNDHSPAATMKVPGKSDRILKENRKIFNS